MQPQKDHIFSIVIPTWNNLPYLKLCLESIKRYSTYPHQIIVHVNEGIDGTMEYLKHHFDGDISYSKENVGVCVAMNLARQMVKTDYLLYLNDDMYVCPNWDRDLVKAVQEAADHHFFYSATLMQPGPFHDMSILANCNYGSRLESFDENRLLAEFDKRTHPDWSGATWPPNVVHVDVWDAVGGYSEEFSPGMYSDPDFSMKLWQHGVRDFRGIGSSRVYHFESVSTGRIKKNPGSKTFLLKWGITNSTFGRHYLRRGQIYKGPLQEPKISIQYIFDHLRSYLKKRWYQMIG
jgi:glycosyltransferase involved in cell wall biosynthesis